MYTKYKLAIMDFYRKYSIRVNKIIPLPKSKKWNSDIYLDNKKEERLHNLAQECSNKEIFMNYCRYVADISYGYQLLEILNDMFTSIRTLSFLNYDLTHYNAEDDLIEAVKTQILAKKDIINTIDRNIDNLLQTKNVWSNLQTLYRQASQEITFENMTGKLFDKLVPLIKWYVKTLPDMSKISSAEVNLLEFCRREHRKEPELLYTESGMDTEDYKEVSYFSHELLED